jgi:putative DNA primase/helicase
MSAALDAALDYARRGWPVFPCNAQKRPLTVHGCLDASTDEAQIRAWYWDGALVGVATGKGARLVVLDIDIRDSGSGLDSLQLLGVNFHPKTLTAHTPSGGIHCFFAWPGHEVPNSASKIGPYLDIRGDGGYVVVPPGVGRFWDPHLGPDTPLAPMPEWMMPTAPERPQAVSRGEHVQTKGHLSPYCEAAIRRACNRIIKAPCGSQESTLNDEAFGLGTLVECWGMPSKLALECLNEAAALMSNCDHRRPWRQKELDRKVTAAFAAGLRHPRPKD